MKKKKKKNQVFTFVEAFVDGERNVPRFTSFLSIGWREQIFILKHPKSKKQDTFFL